MKKRYYRSMLSLCLLIILFDAIYIPAHKTISLFLSLAAIHLVLFIPINFLGIYFLFKPIDQAFRQNKLTVKTVLRIRKLRWLSAAWIFILGASYLGLMLLMLFLFPVDTGDIALNEMPASLWISSVPSILYIYAILPAFITWFLINDFTLDLKTKLFSHFKQNYPAGNKKFGLTLLFTFIILGFFPTILVSLELIISGAGDKYAQFSGMTPLEAVLPDRIIVFIGMVIAVIFITRSFTKPIHSLQEEIDKVQKGDLSREAPVISEDEVGMLTHEFNTMVKGLQEREVIRNTFGKYVPQDIASAILDRKIKLSGEERVCTILVTDIVNYTTITEASTPMEVVKMLNEYFTVLVEIIQANKGVVNEFVGDAVFAMFNVPMDDPDHATNAIKAALAIEKISTTHTFGKHRLTTRIGINTGNVVAGNIGAADRLKFGVVGDDVNIAARLEQLNKEYGTNLLVGENTYDIARRHFNFTQLGNFQLKGKEKTIKVYKVNR